MSYFLFFAVILVTNIIQGITGFAGTILAMPPSLFLVGYDVAKPVLNVLGILAGVYVFITHGKHVDWKELKKVVLVMTVGILSGIFLKSMFTGNESILYKCLGIFIIVLSVQGYYQLLAKKKNTLQAEPTAEKKTGIKSYLLLISSGIVHGMFVSGGPLLIAYLSKTVKEKVSFRATISTVWIILNTIILIDDMRAGLWTISLVKTQVIAVPFFIAGMAVGTKLYKSMSQMLFMKLTYILLFISGISLLFK